MRARLIAILVSLLLFSGSVVGAYFYGRSDEAAHCQAESLTEYQKGVERNEALDSGVQRMDGTDLDNALSHWLRYD